MERKIKYLVLLTVFIDIIGLGIVIPVLPFYVKTFSDSAMLVTLLFAIYSLCSFISAPWIGALSDRYGRRPALIASIASTSIGWFIFAGAPSLLFLFIGRIVDGLAAGNLPVAQSALVDLAKDDKERTANLGLVGAIFGIGFIIGPFLGGALGHFGHSIPFWFVGILAAINTILAYFFLPETRKHDPTHVHRKMSLNPFAPIVRALKDKVLRPSYFSIFLFGLAAAAMHSVFTLYMNDAHGFAEFTIGFLFAGVGVLMALNQAIIMPRFWLKRFTEPSLELWMLLVLAMSYLMLAVPTYTMLILGLIAMTFGQSILHVVMNSQVVAKASQSMRGEVLGVVTSTVSLASGISPIAAGALYTWKAYTPMVMGALLLVIAFFIVLRIRRSMPAHTVPVA